MAGLYRNSRFPKNTTFCCCFFKQTGANLVNGLFSFHNSWDHLFLYAQMQYPYYYIHPTTCANRRVINRHNIIIFNNCSCSVLSCNEPICPQYDDIKSHGMIIFMCNLVMNVVKMRTRICKTMPRLEYEYEIQSIHNFFVKEMLLTRITITITAL